MKHDETKLPKWVQDELGKLRADLEYLRGERDRLEALHALTAPGSHWFTLQCPYDRPNGWALFQLERDRAHHLCTLYENDVLVIGRKRK